MKAKMIVASVVAAIVGLPVGALAVRQSADDRPKAPVTRTDDDGTADQGHGDAPGTVSPGDDDGTADQGHGDAPARCRRVTTTAPRIRARRRFGR
jgi:hypothetical protein